MPNTEEEYLFDFSNALAWEKFDDDRHALSHCMSAVDFVVETKSRLDLIEIKNVNRTRIAAKEIRKYLKKIMEGDPFINELIPKFRDTWLYLWCEGRVTKPVRFFVYLELPHEFPYQSGRLTSCLRQQMPLYGVKRTGRWKRELAHDAWILTPAEWMSAIPEFPIKTKVGE